MPDPQDTVAWLAEQQAQSEPAPSERLRRIAALGAGGMGIVEIVHDQALDRQVAKKMLRPELRDDPKARRVFLREAQLAARLAHPNIIPIYDIGEDDGPFFTMQLVEGRSLTDLLATRPSVLFDLLTILTHVCDAAAFAHSRGVVHCDIKPDNIMVCDYGAVYLVDWGVARVIDADAGAEIVGSPAYMAPEQAAGLRDLVMPASDVFALGAVLFHVLSGRPPYVGESVEETLGLARRGERPRLSELARVPLALERIVDRAMADQARDRYASAEELKAALVRFMRGEDLPMRRFAAGELILREGEVGDGAYVIESGRCEAFRLIDGERLVLREMGPGEVFGEMAVLNAEPRTASVIALEDTVVHEVSARTLEVEVGMLKPWMSAVIRTLAERFRHLERHSSPPSRA